MTTATRYVLLGRNRKSQSWVLLGNLRATRRDAQAAKRGYTILYDAHRIIKVEGLPVGERDG